MSGSDAFDAPDSPRDGWPNCPPVVKPNRSDTHVDVPSISFSDPGSIPGVSTT